MILTHFEPIFSAKTPKEKLAQRQFFFWYKPETRRDIERELHRIGRSDLIAKLYDKPSKQHPRAVYDPKAIGSTPDVSNKKRKGREEKPTDNRRKSAKQNDKRHKSSIRISQVTIVADKNKTVKKEL